MTIRKGRGLIATNALSEDELRAVRGLAALCHAQEGLTLKLNLAPGRPDGAPSKFLYFVDGTLAGYAALFASAYEAELCGMVHPQLRRKGIGRELLEAAMAACRRDGIAHLLLVCEEASRSGRAFVDAIHGEEDFAELHLEMSLEMRPATEPVQPSHPSRLLVREAGAADAAAIAHVVAAAFGGDEERISARTVGELEEPGARFYVGQIGPRVVASLKVYLGADSAGIYAFGVLPAYRNHGYGRELLTRTVERMRAEGRARVYLEVDLDNEPARHLYRSVGFEDVTKYVYYTVPLET